MTAGSKPIFLASSGSVEPDELRHEDGQRHRDANHKGDRARDALVVHQQMVDEHDLREAGRRQTDAAEHRDADLLPHDAEQIAELDLVEADAADDGDARLRTGVAAGVHQHRDECRQAGEHAERRLKVGDDKSRQRRGDHQQQQPRDAVLPNLHGRGAHVRMLGREHSRHFFHILGGLVFHDVPRIVERDDADETVFRVDDGSARKSYFENICATTS